MTKQIPTKVEEDTHFGGWTVDHGGSGMFYVEDRGPRRGQKVAWVGPDGTRFDLTSGEHFAWRVEISPSLSHARRVARNADAISKALLAARAPQGSRISVTFHDDGTATVTDYDYRRFEIKVDVR